VVLVGGVSTKANGMFKEVSGTMIGVGGAYTRGSDFEVFAVASNTLVLEQRECTGWRVATACVMLFTR
jgi:hypothetical protein